MIFKTSLINWLFFLFLLCPFSFICILCLLISWVFYPSHLSFPSYAFCYPFRFLFTDSIFITSFLFSSRVFLLLFIDRRFFFCLGFMDRSTLHSEHQWVNFLYSLQESYYYSLYQESFFLPLELFGIIVNKFGLRINQILSSILNAKQTNPVKLYARPVN